MLLKTQVGEWVVVVVIVVVVDSVDKLVSDVELELIDSDLGPVIVAIESLIKEVILN